MCVQDDLGPRKDLQVSQSEDRRVNAIRIPPGQHRPITLELCRQTAPTQPTATEVFHTNLASAPGLQRRALQQRLAVIEPWTGQAGHEAIEVLADEKQLKLGKVAQPLRVAVSGGTVSPPMDATLEILGKQSTLNRINRCLILDSPA